MVFSVNITIYYKLEYEESHYWCLQMQIVACFAWNLITIAKTHQKWIEIN